MGESFGLYEIGHDEEIMPYITSANIACGFHAGDPGIIKKSVELANKYEVEIGAHPAFPDLLGFGRRYMQCSNSEIKNYITYQLGALQGFSQVYKKRLQHCKPHGALYMMAMEDEKIARVILEAIGEIDENIIVFATNNSAVVHTGNEMGIPIAKETYADREHTKDGSIVLTRTGSQIENKDAMVQRVVQMVKDRNVKAHTGEDVAIHADTICIHSDTPDAPQLIKMIKETLLNHNVEVTSVKHIIR